MRVQLKAIDVLRLMADANDQGYPHQFVTSSLTSSVAKLQWEVDGSAAPLYLELDLQEDGSWLATAEVNLGAAA
jgi:hypothetical protein